MKDSIKEYFDYHFRMASVGDIDPQNLALKYICERFELNIEQRYWMAFLFGCCYCAPTVYYIYNEFPDFENVDVERLQAWWKENKHKTLFQTDRLRVKTQNKLVQTFESYKDLIGKNTQENFYESIASSMNKKSNYDKVFRVASHIKNFGRFSNFIYLELLYELTALKIEPSELDIKNAKSCRNGILYAIDRADLIDGRMTASMVEQLEAVFNSFCSYLKENHRAEFINPYSAWGVETSLCAYKKYKRGKRWVGYYLDRQYVEIKKMKANETHGVNWQPLWDFRFETYNHAHLQELTGRKSSVEMEYRTSETDNIG